MLEVARPGLPGMEIVAEMERVVRRQGSRPRQVLDGFRPAPGLEQHPARHQTP